MASTVYETEICDAVNCWDTFCENWELRSNIAAATQNCLKNTTADIWNIGQM